MNAYEELSKLLSYSESNIALTDWYLSNYTGYYIGHPMFYIDEDNALILYEDNIRSVNLDTEQIKQTILLSAQISTVRLSANAYSELDHFMQVGISASWKAHKELSHTMYSYKGVPVMSLWSDVLIVYDEALTRHSLVLSHLIYHMRSFLNISIVKCCASYVHDTELHRSIIGDLEHILKESVPRKYHLWERTESLISYDDKPVVHIRGVMIMIYIESCNALSIEPSMVRNMLSDLYPSSKYYYTYDRSKNASRSCNNSESSTSGAESR